MTRVVRVLLWVAGSICLTGFTAPSQEPVAAKPDSTPAVDDYRIGNGDVLRIAVWREPELTASAVVRLDGKITVPLVGDMEAAGRTAERLAAEVRTKLQAFVEVPQVTITVSEAVSARFYVIGEVGAAGVYPLTGRITVLQALALAKGFREYAKRDHIIVIRERGGVQKALPFNYKEVELGIRLGQNLALEAGDTVIVP